MDLKELLGEELYKQVVEKAGENKIAVVSDGNWFPKDKFDLVNNDNKELKKQITERDKSLEELKPKAAGNEALLEQIQKLQDDAKTATEKHESELAESRLNSAMKLALTGKFHNVDIALSQLDKSKVILDENGNVKDGLDDQVTVLAESMPFLAIQEQEPPQQQPPSWSGGQHNPPAQTNDDPFAAKMAKYE